MKGSLGLIIAGFLGIAAVGFNMVYLESKTSGVESKEFLGIKTGTVVNAGETLQESHFVPVAIPVKNVSKSLTETVYLYEDRKTVANIKATRSYQGGDLVMREHYRTPKPELDLEPNERLLLVSVDSRNFVPSLVDPGDQITFIVPRYEPKPVAAPGEAGPVVDDRVTLETNELIGPFTVASLGGRLGSVELTRANRGAGGQERIVGIRVRADADKLEPEAMLLLQRLEQSNHRNIQVILHPRTNRR